MKGQNAFTLPLAGFDCPNGTAKCDGCPKLGCPDCFLVNFGRYVYSVVQYEANRSDNPDLAYTAISNTLFGMFATQHCVFGGAEFLRELTEEVIAGCDKLGIPTAGSSGPEGLGNTPHEVPGHKTCGGLSPEKPNDRT